MRIDMTPMLSSRTERLDFSFEYEAENGVFDGIEFDKPISVEGNVTEKAGCMLLTLKASVSYGTECARCLKRLHREHTFELSKNVAVSGSLQDEDNDDYVIVEDRALLLSDIVDELLFLELPSRDLCTEDCLGLCPKCGKDLNEGGCSCVTKETDPRLAALSRFLTDSEDNN